MDKKEKLLKYIGDIPLGIAMAGLIFAVSMTCVNVFTRYFLDFTYAGTSEMISIAFTWLIFSGTAYAYKQGKHYGIDLLVDALPHMAQKVIKILIDILMMVVFVYCVQLSVTYTCNVADSPMPALRISYAWYYSSAIYGFAMMLYYAAKDLIQDIRHFKGKGGKGE